MYSHILVPVAYDHDRDEGQPLDIAQRLCREGGKVTFLHVMEEIPGYVIKYMPDNFGDEARESIHADLEQRAAGFPNSEARVIMGHAGRTIVEFAEEHEVNLIVIASHRPGIGDFFLGSTAARVVRHAQCSVHVIR